MKKICIFILALAVINLSYAQSADPAVNGAQVTPNPGKVNGQGQFTFNFQNLGAGDMTMAPVATTVKITLNKLEPVLNNGVPQVTGPGAGFFNWTYNSGTKTITGAQNKVIPASTDPMNPVGGAISIDVVFSVAATAAEAAANNGNGGNVNIQPGAGGNADQTNDNTANYTFTDGALPVAFGFTSASFTGGQLKAEWSTFTETDNKSFTIEVSKDGKTFTQIDAVATKAENGDSKTEIKYTYSRNWQEIASKFGFSPLQLAILVLLMISVLVTAKRAKKGAMLLSLALLFTVGIGCRRDKKEFDKLDRYPTTFLRIGQINKDGTTTNYSKVVKVVAE